MDSRGTSLSSIHSRTRFSRDVRQRRREPSDPSLIAQNELVEALRKLNTAHVAPILGWHAHLSETTVSNYFAGHSAPSSYMPLLLLLWLHREQHSGRVARFHKEHRVSRLLSVFNPLNHLHLYIVQGRRLPEFGRISVQSPALTQDGVAAAKAILGHVAGTPPESPKSTLLTYGSSSLTYYMTYRRSQVDEYLIKGFLALSQPSVAAKAIHSFSYFYRNTADELRVTRGIVMNVGGYIYLFGGVGQATEDTGGNSGHLLVDASGAMKVVVIDSRCHARSHHVWPGMFLSAGLELSPIAGRCVLVRTCFSSFQETGIGVLPPSKLREDLKNFATAEALGPGDASAESLAAAIVRVSDNSQEPNDFSLQGPLTFAPIRV